MRKNKPLKLSHEKIILLRKSEPLRQHPYHKLGTAGGEFRDLPVLMAIVYLLMVVLRSTSRYR